MKKNNLYFSALVLILGLSFTNCHSKSDNSLYQTNALLFNYVNSLLAGNCATVEKLTSSAGVVTYAATGYNIPSGGCNSSTLGSFYTTTASEIVTKSDAYFDKITAVLDTYSACSVISGVIKGTNTTITGQLKAAKGTLAGVGVIKTETTATNITSAATANTADSETNGPKNCKTVKIGLLYTAGIFCSSATDSTNAQNNFKYYVVNSVIADMATNFNGNREILTLAKTSTDSVSYYTKSAMNALRMMTSAEVATIKTDAESSKADTYALANGLYGLAALGTLTTANVTGCLAAITAGNSTTKDYLMRIPFAYYTTIPVYNSDITFADRQAVTTPFLPYVACKYGAGFTGATSTIVTTTAGTAVSTAAVGACPSTYTSF